MKFLFLDIDGVVNSEESLRRTANGGIVGIDPYMAFLIGNMVDNLGLKVVLSSSWRGSKENLAQIEQQVCPIFGSTPRLVGIRGEEIKKWIDDYNEYSGPNGLKDKWGFQNEPIEKYAIIDDDSDMLPEQMPNFFKTEWKTGVTKEIIDKIVNHFN